MTVRVLSFHAGYGCRRSGACCTAGWPIAAEPRVESGLRDALGRGALRLRVSAEPFTHADDNTAMLALDHQRRCVFFEPGTPNACAVHRQLGHEWLPLSCRQFPRVSLLTPDGASVTLSHYCPTAAGLLFDGGAVRIVEDAPAFPAAGEYEGLDARAAWPLLRPGVRLDWESHRCWEEHAVATVAREDLAPEAALERLRADAEAARLWTPERGPLLEWIAQIAGAVDRRTEEPRAEFAAALASWRAAALCVPAGAALQPPALDEAAAALADARHLQPLWPSFVSPVRRYLAAKAFASWCAVQGEGLRTAVAFLALARDVLRVEAARACAAVGAPLERETLKRALRAADLLLVHLADPAALARHLSAVELDA